MSKKREGTILIGHDAGYRNPLTGAVVHNKPTLCSHAAGSLIEARDGARKYRVGDKGTIVRVYE